MTEVRVEIDRCLRRAMELAGSKAPAEFGDELVLLNSGLDSLGLAMLVVELEERLGYDPFTLMEEPVYPKTFGEFVDKKVWFLDYNRPSTSRLNIKTNLGALQRDRHHIRSLSDYREARRRWNGRGLSGAGYTPWPRCRGESVA